MSLYAFLLCVRTCANVYHFSVVYVGAYVSVYIYIHMFVYMCIEYVFFNMHMSM